LKVVFFADEVEGAERDNRFKISELMLILRVIFQNDILKPYDYFTPKIHIRLPILAIYTKIS
jgi:hypothetical protein